MLEQITIISLLSTTCLISFRKWGWFDYYDMYRKSWMPDRCEFCFGFWVAILLTLFLGIYKGFYPEMLILPFASASLTNIFWRWIEV